MENTVKRDRGVRRSHIGGYIAELRIEKGLSISQLSNSIGIAQSHLGRIERGLVKPAYRLMADIAEALDVNLNDFSSVGARSQRVQEALDTEFATMALPDDDKELLARMSLAGRELLARRLGLLD